MKVKITEVGPRDGLQNEKSVFTIAQRKTLINDLLKAGVKHIEPGAFVSPVWVPRMAGSDKLHKQLNKTVFPKYKNIRATYLVPNAIGMQAAIEAGVKDVAIFASSTEAFAQRNTNCSIKESFERMTEVVSMAQKNKIKVRGYLSTVFGCPYEGKVSESKVLKVAEKMFDFGVYELSFGDTIGVANPKQVRSLTKKLQSLIPNEKIVMHFHDTRGMALANILASLDCGVKNFDSSIGGLGGCPYAEGATGNVATEDVVNMLHQMGVKTGLDLAQLVKTTRKLEKSMGRALPSKLSKIKLG